MSEIKKSFWKKIFSPIMDQLKQGASPKGLAATCATGATIATFPLLGTTTALCLLIGIRFKLNQPVLQAVNYLFYPLQLLLLPVFILYGAKLTSSPPVTFVPEKISAEFLSSPTQFMSHYGMAGLHAILAWAIVAPALGFLIYQLAFVIFKKVLKSQDIKREL